MSSPSIKIKVAKGKSYAWCSCGLSKNQPFCDGSHKEDEQGRKPVIYESVRDGFINFCSCRKTQHPPLCDGSHRQTSQKQQENK